MVGATGAVGRTMLELLRERAFPADEIVPFASVALGRASRSTAAPSRCSTTSADLSGFDIALFSAGAGTSREWAPRFVDAGAVVDRQLLGLPPRPVGPARRLRGQPARARATTAG